MTPESLHIRFDRHIDSSLPTQTLWGLIKEAFEDPGHSPLWPVELEEVEPIVLRPGEPVTATYKVGPFRFRPAYHIRSVEQGRRFSYESDSTHPLAGGATVEVSTAHDGSSTLRWRGAYQPRLHPLAIGAVLFVRWYFLEHFFERLEQNLRKIEATANAGGDMAKNRRLRR